jgi:hypothetical protein
MHIYKERCGTGPARPCMALCCPVQLAQVWAVPGTLLIRTKATLQQEISSHLLVAVARQVGLNAGITLKSQPLQSLYGSIVRL